MPNGYDGDATEAVIAQIERFAPGVRERIVGTATRSPAEFEAGNANYVGGDIITGANTARQILLRPRIGVDPYATGVPGVYLCSAATPPGPGRARDVRPQCGARGAARPRRGRPMSDAEAFVYLLRCRDGTLYCGWTNDLERRLRAHSDGHRQPLHAHPPAGQARLVCPDGLALGGDARGGADQAASAGREAATDAHGTSPPLTRLNPAGVPADRGRVNPAAPSMETTQGVSLPTSRPLVKRRLGDVVVDLGYAEREDVEAAVATAVAARRPVGQVMIDAGIVNSDQLARALAERNGLPYANLNMFEVDRGAANLVSPLEARRYRAVPISFVDEQTLLVATSNPANVVGRDDIAMATGYDVQLAVTSPEHLEHLINNLAQAGAKVQRARRGGRGGRGRGHPHPVVELLESASEAPVVQLVHSVIADAVERGASDIHFDPRDGDMRVRFRVDGVVIDTTTVPRKLVPGLVSRIKIMAELDIAERQLPQDGRIGLTIDGRYVELRVATLPVMRGESVVMRILDKDRLVIELDRLGMAEGDRRAIEDSISKIHGAVLVTGPTGAGKTTTLYAAMTALNSPERTMIAIEDPVEYELDGIKQVQVQTKRGPDVRRGTPLDDPLRSRHPDGG